MCWKCDHPEATSHECLDLIYEKVQESGRIVQFVQDRTPFAYTIGLRERGLPELLVAGMPPERANLVLDTVAKCLVRGGRPVRQGVRQLHVVQHRARRAGDDAAFALHHLDPPPSTISPAEW